MALREVEVARHLRALPCAPCRPVGVGARSADVPFREHVRDVAVHVGPVAQPAALAHVVAEGTRDRVVRARPADVRQELAHRPAAVLRAAQVLAVRPPAEVVRPLDVLVGTLEERDLAPDRPQRRLVGKRVRVDLVDVEVEAVEAAAHEVNQSFKN